MSVNKLPPGQNVLDWYKIQLMVRFGLAVYTLNLGIDTMNPDGAHIPDFYYMNTQQISEISEICG